MKRDAVKKIAIVQIVPVALVMETKYRKWWNEGEQTLLFISNRDTLMISIGFFCSKKKVTQKLTASM